VSKNTNIRIIILLVICIFLEICNAVWYHIEPDDRISQLQKRHMNYKTSHNGQCLNNM